MTLQEIEQSFKLHEERFARLDQMREEHELRFKRIDERLDRMSEHAARADERLERLSAEYEQRFKRIEDNLAVQGEILNRIDQRLDHVTERLDGLNEVVRLNTNQLAIMQSAMTSLFQRMDAFIQGLERGNGDKPQGRPQ